MSRVSIIIPNYKGIDYIRGCLDSIRKQTYKDFEVIMPDNASGDGSLEVVTENYPEVKVIPLKENFGFSRAINEGLKVSRAEYVLLLNNDTVVHEQLVEKLVGTMDTDERIFSVASKMLQLNAPEKIDGAGDLYCALGWAFARGKDKKSTRYTKRQDVFAACAGAALYRRRILDEIGWFDEFHFAYLEDVDIGYRARIMGYRNVYEPEAIVYHAGSGVSGSRHNDFKVRISARNNMYVIMKNMPTGQIILNLPFLVAGFGIKALYFICRGYGRAYLSGIKRGYLLCREGRKYPFSSEHLKNYARIQLELYLNTIKRFTDLI